MKNIHIFDNYFDASNKNRNESITIGGIERWAKEEDENDDRRKGELAYHLLSVKKESWFDKFLNYIYA